MSAQQMLMGPMEYLQTPHKVTVATLRTNQDVC